MAQLVKTVAGLAIASVKTCAGLAIASVKTVNGLDNTSGGGGNTPTFAEQIAANPGPTESAATTVLTLTSAVAAGAGVAVIFSWTGAGQMVSSIVDSSGTHTYTVNQTQTSVGTISGLTVFTIIATAVATAGLSAANTITINWASPDFGYRFGRAFEIGDIQASGQPEVSAKNSVNNANPTAAASTTSTLTCGIGAVICGNATYTVATWTKIGTDDFIDSSFHASYIFKNITSSGSQDPAGTLSGAQVYNLVWAAFK